MARAFLIVMDSAGCGGAPDAAAFGDEGSNTLGHIAAACAEGRAEVGRSGPLKMPNLDRLGLGAAIRLASGAATPGLGAVPEGLWGAATEVSTYFPDTVPAFPDDILAEVCRLAGTEGILGNCHASGVPIIAEHCEEHLRTGWPICYTSADSVFQIACHEEAFGLERLLKLCKDLAPMLHARKVGRVIARPFTGGCGDFKRTSNRKDFAIAPPAPTLLDWVSGAGRATHAIGKIGDIFSMQGIGSLWKGKSDADLFEHLVRLGAEAEDGSLTFANFVEFDTLYGHPRDVAGYAQALEWFDAGLPRFFAQLRPGDLVIFTADHGNDPTFRGTEHTRERVPVVGCGVGLHEVGLRGFVDVGASVAAHLGVGSQGPGRSFL